MNAPFDLFTSTRFNYPYTLRTTLTTNRAPRRWRTLNVENEYLRCVILPDLGGHLYNCVDKVNGRDLFYANRRDQVRERRQSRRLGGGRDRVQLPHLA